MLREQIEKDLPPVATTLVLTTILLMFMGVELPIFFLIMVVLACVADAALIVTRKDEEETEA
jgi:hypothetical protein